MAKGKFERAAPPRQTEKPIKQPPAEKKPSRSFLKQRQPEKKPSRAAVKHSPVRQRPAQQETLPEEKSQKPNRIKALWSLLKNGLVGLVVLAAMVMVAFTAVSLLTVNGTGRSVFGYRAYVVLSDSMRATDFDAGDVVLVKEVDPATLQVGDIIAFTSRSQDTYGEVVTHKIRSLTTDQYGNPGFITYGTTTDTDDEAVVTYSDILGKYQYQIPKIGYFFQFVKTGPGYVLCIFLPFGLLIAWQGLNAVRLFRQDKKEEMQKLQAERDQVAAERAETQQMLLELKKMQEQLMQEREKKP